MNMLEKPVALILWVEEYLSTMKLEAVGFSKTMISLTLRNIKQSSNHHD
jgi:hypothetical protein